MTHVLIVEDESDVATVLQSFLEEEGISSSVVHTAVNARALLLQRPDKEHPKIDLVLLDFGLTDTLGIEFLRWIRDAGFATPVIVMSGGNDVMDYFAEVQELSRQGFLSKPFTPRQLVWMVNKALGKLETAG